MRVELFAADRLAPGQMCAVQVGDVSVVVLRKADGGFRALRNRCSHQGGELAKGRLEPMLEASDLGQYCYSESREVLRCPLHQFEFDVDSGLSPADPEHVRVRSYPVTVEAGRVFVER